MQTECSSGYKVICTKHGVYLEKSKTEANLFRLTFLSTASLAQLKEMSMIQFYQQLGTLNTDIIKEIEYTKLSPYKLDITLLFIQFAKEFGVAPKTMVLRLEDRSGPNNIHFTGHTPPNNVYDNDTGVICNDSTLHITSPTSENIQLTYIFHLDLQEDFPNYLENIAGLLIKKIFLRLKQFIER